MTKKRSGWLALAMVALWVVGCSEAPTSDTKANGDDAEVSIAENHVLISLELPGMT